MWFFFNEDEQVSGSAASFAGITFSAQAQLHTFLYACRDVDVHHFFTIYASFTFTVTAFAGDGLAFPMTGRTGCYCLHLTQEGLRYFPYLTGTTTGATGLEGIFIFRSQATAMVAGNVFFNLDLFIGAFGDLFVGKTDLDAQVGTSGPPAASSATTATTVATRSYQRYLLRRCPRNWRRYHPCSYCRR